MKRIPFVSLIYLVYTRANSRMFNIFCWAQIQSYVFKNFMQFLLIFIGSKLNRKSEYSLKGAVFFIILYKCKKSPLSSCHWPFCESWISEKQSAQSEWELEIWTTQTYCPSIHNLHNEVRINMIMCFLFIHITLGTSASIVEYCRYCWTQWIVKPGHGTDLQAELAMTDMLLVQLSCPIGFAALLCICHSDEAQ